MSNVFRTLLLSCLPEKSVSVLVSGFVSVSLLPSLSLFWFSAVSLATQELSVLDSASCYQTLFPLIHQPNPEPWFSDSPTKEKLPPGSLIDESGGLLHRGCGA